MPNWLERTFGEKSRGSQRGRAELLRRYDAYLQVLRANTDVLELLAELEGVAASGGSFARRRFKATVTRLGIQVYAMARMLHVMAGSRYDDLIPAIDTIRMELAGILEEEPVPSGQGPWVVPLSALAGAKEDSVGGKAANLGRMLATGEVRVPEGFAISVGGFRAFLQQNGLEQAVRVFHDALDPDDPVHLDESAQRMRQAILHGTLPRELAEALDAASAGLYGDVPPTARFAVRSSATGEDGAFSFAGQYTSLLDIPAAEIAAAYIRVLAGFFNPRAVLMRLKRGHGALELGMGALVLRMVSARVSGVAYSTDPLAEEAGRVLVDAVAGSGSALVGGRAVAVSWAVDRATRRVESRSLRPIEEPLLSDQKVVEVAELALRAEQVLGCHSDVEWAFDASARLWLLQARPLALAPRSRGQELPPYPGARIVLEGGICASPGAGIGPVVRVRAREDALLLPPGTVMVAAEALPDLALALPRVRAVLAERGGVTGHLATVARELGVPALFGVDEALSSLEDGAVVTVDATACRVYEGEVREALEERRPPTPVQCPGGLGRIMEKVLSLVLPLNLTDPASEQFAPAHCKTFHDVVRFIHEKALMETLGLGDAAKGESGPWFRVNEPLSLDLRLVPLEGGVEAAPGRRAVKVEQVTSIPARALLQGLLDPAVRRKGPAPIDVGGFLSVVSETMVSDTELGGPTWAMVSDRYLQLSSRIGYHFATLEAFASPRAQDNRIRFVFKGGAAGEARRMRRAHFIARVLEGMGFQVTVKGDFVSGTYGQAPEDRIRELLAGLGRLLVCANRLDMLLGDEMLAVWYADGFLAGDYARILGGETPPREGAGSSAGGSE